MAVSVAMKVAPVSSGWSPHEDTTGMDSKPQAQFPSYNDDEQSYSNNAYQLDDGSIVVPQSLSEMTHEGYYHQPDHLSTHSIDSGTYQQPPPAYMMHDTQQRHAPPPPIYSPGGAIYSSSSPPSHAQLHHPSPPQGYTAYPPPPNHYGTIAMPGGPSYYSGAGHHPSHHMDPMAAYNLSMQQQQHHHHRASLSSYSSSHSFETLGSLSKRHGRGGRAGSSRHGNKQHHRHYTHGGGGGSPPNRGWYRFDANTTLYQMKGRIVEIAKDRDGSKFIQRRLQVADPIEMQIVYDEAIVDIEKLWDDVYGNYILQGMLDLGTKEMRDGIGDKIMDGNVVELSTKVYGCRLIQKALDTLDKQDVANIVTSIKGKVWLLVHDHNGNHVIQRSITKINEFVAQATTVGLEREGGEEQNEVMTTSLVNALDIIIDEVTSSIKELATHPYGCRVVQRLIEHCHDAQKDKVLDCIFDADLSSSLINHEYGNYVIQRFLTYGRLSDKAAVFETITKNNNILKLSKQKHSSNVVEMMLTYGDVEQRHQIIDGILNCVCIDQMYESKNAALSMAEDAYANYVLRTAIDVLENCPLKERLFSMLISNMEALEQSPFAKQIVLRVKTYTQVSGYE